LRRRQDMVLRGRGVDQIPAPARPVKRTAGESGAPRPPVCRGWRRPGPASVLVAVAVFAACGATAALAQTNGSSSTGLASIAMSPAATASFIAESDAIFAALAVPPATPPAELPFIRENHAAMTKMVACMAVNPTGNIDDDFAAMMVPHHQGAIDMPEAELHYGKSAELRRIAQEIIVDQMQEITLMRLAVGEPLPPSASSPTDPLPASAFQASPWMPVCGGCPSAR
jgi:Domain of unknown function (DUF305)